MSGEAPGPWELQRSHEQIRADMREGFGGLNGRLDRLVTTDAFTAEQRRVDDKLKDLADDIVAEREARKEGDKNQQVALDKLVTNQKWILVAIVLPIALFIGNLIISKG